MTDRKAQRKILFYVQHLLGIGHLRRAATLSRELDRAGFDVTLVSGGHEIEIDLGGAKLHQLPPVRAKEQSFKILVDENGQDIDDNWRDKRAAQLLRLWQNLQPDIIITELFPFGRRQMRFELRPLLDAAKKCANPPLIVSSVRDILVAQKDPKKVEKILELVNAYFDQVIVHGDPALISLDQTFPHLAQIGDRIHYSGYVVDKKGIKGGTDAPGAGEVIVSGGGGAVGGNLLEIAMDARAMSVAKDRIWRIMVGTNVPDEEFMGLVSRATKGVIVERARPDFTTLLMNCALSISQGGYNTVMEILHAQCRAVIVPFAAGQETEQSLRADLLAKKGVLHVADEVGLTSATLAQKINDALASPVSSAHIDVNGGLQTAALLKQWLDDKS